ncbi:MAG: hypothetical protein F8N39_11500 [Clostridiaceae bacterium]|nr:hypothetical protein [Clostridiaceae bacterium]
MPDRLKEITARLLAANALYPSTSDGVHAFQRAQHHFENHCREDMGWLIEEILLLRSPQARDLTDPEINVLKEAYRRVSGRAWAPYDPHHPTICNAIAAGYLRRVDGLIGCEVIKGQCVAWTQAGRAAIAVTVRGNSSNFPEENTHG